MEDTGDGLQGIRARATNQATQMDFISLPTGVALQISHTCLLVSNLSSSSEKCLAYVELLMKSLIISSFYGNKTWHLALI